MYMRVCVCMQEEQAAKLKADNIRVALEKIKEAQVKKVSPENRCWNTCGFYLYVVHMLSCVPFLCASVYSKCPADSVYGSGQCYSALKALVDNSWGQNTHAHLHAHTHRQSTQHDDRCKLSLFRMDREAERE